MSAAMIFFLICASFFITSYGESDCFFNNIDSPGTNVNAEHSIRTADANSCQKLCQKEDRCRFWTWVSPEFNEDSSYLKDCYLKEEKGATFSRSGLISGPKFCSGDSDCCDDFQIETIGGGNFYQEERMGSYLKVGTSQDGRNVYRQENGDNYMYYLVNRGYWMIGNEIGRDLGGVLSRTSSQCPENSNNLWEYWNDWQEEWRQDSNMEVKCDDGGNNGDDEDKGCASGPVCDGCSVWASVNGVKYCCATNCDYGYVEVSSENGQVICHCYQ